MPSFEVGDINIVHTKNPFAFATVKFESEETLTGNNDVVQAVSVKARINLPVDATIEGLQQAFLEKAVSLLGLALAELEGKNARELSIASDAQFEQ